MKKTIRLESLSESLIRKFVREAMRNSRLRQSGAGGPGVTTDPTDTSSPYGPDPERGTDIYAYWYRSPGDKTTGGNFRPDNPADYIGMTPPPEAAAPATTTESDSIEEEEEID